MVGEQQEADKNRTRRTEAAEVLLIYEERKKQQMEGEWFCPLPLYLLPFMSLIQSALLSVWKVEPSTWILGSQMSWDKLQNPPTLIRDKPWGWMDVWMETCQQSSPAENLFLMWPFCKLHSHHRHKLWSSASWAQYASVAVYDASCRSCASVTLGGGFRFQYV